MYIFGIFILLGVISNGTNLEKRQAKPILVGSTFFLLLSTATNVIFPSKDINVTKFATFFSIVWAISIFYTVVKHKLFIIVMPAVNETDTPQRYHIENGKGYLIKEETPEKGFDIFYDQITHGTPGLYITKLQPDKVIENYGLNRNNILWLTYSKSERTISPKDIDGLTSLVSDFFRKTKESILYLDCLDQIKFSNGFERLQSIIRDFKKLCKDNESSVLVSVPPMMFEKSQLADIEKAFEEVIVN